ncbi:MAG: twin-arginine translocation signal domain-containing protein, partial [Candidatus Limnocylindrales bacterium]
MEIYRPSLTRRSFLRVSAATAGTLALAGVLPRTLFAQGTSAAAALQVTSPNPAPDSSATVLVRDVLDYRLQGDFAWNGGLVTFRLHRGIYGSSLLIWVASGVATY